MTNHKTEFFEKPNTSCTGPFEFQNKISLKKIRENQTGQIQAGEQLENTKEKKCRYSTFS